jgi:hypothetical protein
MYSTKIRSPDLRIPLLVPTLSPVNFTPSCHHQFLNVIIILDPINSKVKFYLHKNVYFTKKSTGRQLKLVDGENLDIGNIPYVLVRKTFCSGTERSHYRPLLVTV